MIWTVLNETDQKIKLVSKGSTDGILPKGSFLTVEDNKSKRKFILRVDESKQVVPYSPSPLLSDMDLEYLEADKKCKNEITAYRVKDVFEPWVRSDGEIYGEEIFFLRRKRKTKRIMLGIAMIFYG